jgi:hypothetical protein
MSWLAGPSKSGGRAGRCRYLSVSRASRYRAHNSRPRLAWIAFPLLCYRFLVCSPVCRAMLSHSFHPQNPGSLFPFPLPPPIDVLPFPFPQLWLCPPSPLRTRCTSWQKLCRRPGSRTPLVMLAGPRSSPPFASHSTPSPSRARKVKCNRIPGNDKVGGYFLLLLISFTPCSTNHPSARYARPKYFSRQLGEPSIHSPALSLQRLSVHVSL